MLTRKFIMSVMMISLIALGLAACGGSNDTSLKSEEENAQETESEQAPSTLEAWAEKIKEEHEGTEINLAFASHPSTEAFQKMTKKFEELTGITVKWDVMEQTYLKNKQLMDFTAQTGTYDVFMVDNFWNEEYVSKQVIDPLDDYLQDESLTPEWFDYEDIVPAYRDGLSKHNGKVYGIPTAGETRFVGYR